MNRPHKYFWIAALWAFVVGLIGCASNAAAEEPAAKIPPAVAREVDFVKDVRPILQRNCYKCHGPEKEKSGYRLDVRQTALTGGDAYAPNVMPGKGAESPLLRFVAGVDDVVMPPEGPRLTKDEVGILRAWIDQGARWPDAVAGQLADKHDWWSLKPLVRPDAPRRSDAAATNPIDAFIAATLADKGFPAAPAADRRTLIRRLTFDLHGLPPTPEEIDAFVAERDPAAYERLVDRLLASPRYGERWARHWIDAAHFAETHGHDQDRVRENAWPYRDYLIAAFNSDKPYARFVQEQVAGDALFPDDSSATAALGFLAAGPWDESSLRDIQEDTLDRQIARYVDRDDMLATVMNNVTSATVQCARCHDHKFDPISQVDYYSLQAVFAGVERANRALDADPAVGLRRRELLARKALLERTDAASAAALLSPAVQEATATWERGLSNGRVRWATLAPEAATSSEGAELKTLPDHSVLSGGKRPDRDTCTITARSPLRRMTAIRLEVLADDSLPHRGPGRQDNGNLHLSEIQVFVGEVRGDARPLVVASADFNQQGWGIERAVDGLDLTAWGIFPQVGQTHTAAFEFKEPLQLGPDERLVVVLEQLHGGGHLIGRARLSVTDAAPPVRLDVLPSEITAVLDIPAERRTSEQRVALARHQQREVVQRDLASLPKPTMIYAAASDFEPDGGLRPPPGPRPIHVLHRGDVRNPRAPAAPGALSCVAGIESRFVIDRPEIESSRRAALARWLTDPRHPLTWRSIVNRVWQHHFGRGIVGTANDFGRMGVTPTHPELLDWLAVEFRDRGQSIKQLHRSIVTSAAYRRSSRLADIASPAARNAAALDADNRYLWRMNRTRLDAECVRDAVLAISGRLDLRMGGPSDRQFDLQPGIHVTPKIDYAKFDLDSAAGRRRSVYRFLFRTLPDPFMEALDCPSGDQITPMRVNSVTVQQALAMWNDAFIARHCEHFAARLTTAAPSTEGRVVAAWRLAVGRSPEGDELRELTAYADKHGLANACRLLLNSNEFLFVD